jgi:hypothetical protein
MSTEMCEQAPLGYTCVAIRENESRQNKGCASEHGLWAKGSGLGERLGGKEVTSERSHEQAQDDNKRARIDLNAISKQNRRLGEYVADVLDRLLAHLRR